MKKNIFLLFIALTGFVLWLGAASAVFAQDPQGGVVGAFHGTVEAVSSDGSTRVLKSGDPIYLGERLNTEIDSHLQILLMDETVLTLGPSSAIAVDEFVYDPASADGKVKASVIQGIFRVVSGKVAHKKPENMTIDLPAGSIGFRGTFVAGRSEGMRSLVVLLGPAEQEGVAPGRIFVSNTVDGAEVGVEINQKGYGTVIEGENVAPAPAFEVPENEIAAITGALNGVSDESGMAGANQAAASPGSLLDPQSMSQALSVMSQMDEFAQKAAQGGMLTPPQAVTTPGVMGGRDDGDNSNNNSQNNP
jgi:hypothetical protein